MISCFLCSVLQYFTSSYNNIKCTFICAQSTITSHFRTTLLAPHHVMSCHTMSHVSIGHKLGHFIGISPWRVSKACDGTYVTQITLATIVFDSLELYCFSWKIFQWYWTQVHVWTYSRNCSYIPSYNNQIFAFKSKFAHSNFRNYNITIF